MNRLDRFRFGNVHKRRMFGLLGVLASVLILSLIMLAVLGIFGSRSELVRIRLTSANAGLGSNGVGINLDYIPVVNRVRDPSFETTENYLTLPVADYGGDYVFFDTSEDLDALSTVSGSGIRIFSIDNDGTMNLRFEGTVLGFDDARFGSFLQLDDVEGYWLNDPVSKMIGIDNTIVALTQNGDLLTDINSASLMRRIEDYTFTDICSDGDSVYALAEDGTVFYSADGRNFTIYGSCEEGPVYRSIAAASGNVIVITEEGDLLIIDSGIGREIEVPFDTDTVTLCSGNGYIFAADGENNAYLSTNGLIFSRVDEFSSLMTATDHVISSDYGDDFFEVLTSSGHLINVKTDRTVSAVDISSIEPGSITIDSNGKTIAVTSDKKACMIDETTGQISDLTSGTMMVDDIYRGTDDNLVIRNGNNLYSADVMAGLQLDNTIGTDAVFPGDLCVINGKVSAVSGQRVWEIIGDDTLAAYSDDSSVRLVGTSEGVHALSQELSGTSEDNFSDNNFYRIGLRLRKDGNFDGEVKIWISGEAFGEEGFTVQGITDKWNDYSYVFAITEGRLSENDKLHFNIAFEGTGTIFVDDIYLGEDRYDGSAVSSEFIDAVTDASPAAVRLNNLGFGSEGFSRRAFYGMSSSSNALLDNGEYVSNCASLEESLRLVRDAGSCPWFVIGSYADQGDINNFMTYLCGSVSSDYGRLRIDNGTALPWSRQFDTIYIEINDPDGICSSDMERGAYVSYVINLISQSEYYREIKDRTVFLDGMNYEGGIVLSSADHHCAPVYLEGTGDDFDSMVRAIYSDANYDSPRVTTPASDSGEFVSSLSFGPNMKSMLNQGRFITSVLCDEASFVRMSMIDLQASRRPVDTESDMILSGRGNTDEERAAEMRISGILLNGVNEMSFLKHAVALYYDIADPMDSASVYSAEAFSEACTVALVENSNGVYLLIANNSNEQMQFVLESGALDFNEALITRYSSEGGRLTQRHMDGVGRFLTRNTLQPGEVMIIQTETKEED